MANFKLAHDITQGLEGGKSNHKADRGGYTYRGISRRNWPNWRGWSYVDQGLEVPDELVDEFYKANFWDRISLGSINNQKIANELYDTGVNASPKMAVTFLQKALNLLNQEGGLYPDISVDGILGTKTLHLTNEHPYPDALLKLLNGLQLAYYIAICEKDPTQEVFLRGWLKRVI
jgi:lysozyme family protein